MVSATVEQPPSQLSSSGIRWSRVVVGGVLLEFALVAALLPIGEFFGAPPGLGRNETQNAAVFLTAVPVACFVLGYFAGRIVVRKISHHRVAHGLLVGVVATTFYLVMSSLNPQGLAGVIAAYGAIHFWGTQILRIVGCTLGGFRMREFGEPEERESTSRTVLDDQLAHSELWRMSLHALRYPVLIIQRGRPLGVYETAESLTWREGGLLVDNQGVSYQVVDIDKDGRPLMVWGSRAQRRQLTREWKNRPHYVSHKGEPVQLSVGAVRMKIVWLVSARGHFESPQGLPDLSRAETVAELIEVLLATGFR